MNSISIALVVLVEVLAPAEEVLAGPIQARSSQSLPSVFRSQQACESALVTGQFRYYEPKYLGGSKKNPVNGNNKVKVFLPYDMCLDLYTVVGWRFVVQKKGTAYRADRKQDGSLVLYARDDCGNPTRGGAPFSSPPPPPVAVSIPTPEPPMRQQRQPIEPRPAPTPSATPAPVVEVEKEDVAPSPPSSSQWGLTASGMIGSFDSIPIGGDGGFIESIAGRRVCVQGRTVDLGLARGGVASSFWRFTFASKSFRKGSFTEFTCPSCTQEVRIVEDGNVRTLGLQVERVQGFKNKTWGAIRPMVSLSVGAGRISGSVRRSSGHVGKPHTISEVVDASELFDSRWVANAGVGVGVMGDLGRNFTYAVTVVGVEYPGRYFGRVSLTYWPKKK